MPATLVEVGTFLRPHGLQGEIALDRLSDSETLPYARIIVGGRELAVQSARRKARLWLLKLRGIETREEASTLTGLSACVPRDDLPALPEDELYLCDLPGMRVLDGHGELLGTVKDVVNYGSGDLIELEGGALIPLSAPFLVHTDREKRVIEVRIPDGLLENA